MFFYFDSLRYFLTSVKKFPVPRQYIHRLGGVTWVIWDRSCVLIHISYPGVWVSVADLQMGMRGQYWQVWGWAEDEMIVSGVHLCDKQAAHVLLIYRGNSHYLTPLHPLRPPSFLANPGLKSSLGSADSGDWVLNTIPTHLFIFQSLSMTLPPP